MMSKKLLPFSKYAVSVLKTTCRFCKMRKNVYFCKEKKNRETSYEEKNFMGMCDAFVRMDGIGTEGKKEYA